MGGLGGVAPQIGGKRPRPGYRFAVALGGVRQELVLRVNTTSTYPADQRPIGRKNPRGRPPGGFSLVDGRRIAFSGPQAHRRHAGIGRHIPALGVALKADLSPRPAAQPVRHEDFKGLAAMDVPAVPCKAVSLGFIGDLKHFSHCLPLSLFAAYKAPCNRALSFLRPFALF